MNDGQRLPTDSELRSRMRRGEIVYGTLAFEFHTFGLPQIVARAGGDFVVLDLEATSLSMGRLGGILRSARSTPVTAIVRIPEIAKAYASRCLDAGAGGIMAPMVESAGDAERLVELSKYPPLGRRGAAFGIAHDDYDGSDPAGSMKQANEERVIIAQIESVSGVENVNAIAAVPGVDALWIGHNDLLNSMGLPNDRSHPDFQAAVEEVRSACTNQGVTLAGVAGSISSIAEMVAGGYGCISLMSDVKLFQHAFKMGMDAGRDSADR